MAWKGRRRACEGDSDVHALSYEGTMARTLTGQMAGPGKRGREGRREGAGLRPSLVFFSRFVYFLFNRNEKRRNIDKTNNKILGFDFPQHKMLVILQNQNNICICFVQNSFWLLDYLFSQFRKIVLHVITHKKAIYFYLFYFNFAKPQMQPLR